jgi:hypothetical protein
MRDRRHSQCLLCFRGKGFVAVAGAALSSSENQVAAGLLLSEILRCGMRADGAGCARARGVSHVEYLLTPESDACHILGKRYVHRVVHYANDRYTAKTLSYVSFMIQARPEPQAPVPHDGKETGQHGWE